MWSSYSIKSLNQWEREFNTVRIAPTLRSEGPRFDLTCETSGIHFNPLCASCTPEESKSTIAGIQIFYIMRFLKLIFLHGIQLFKIFDGQ